MYAKVHLHLKTNSDNSINGKMINWKERIDIQQNKLNNLKRSILCFIGTGKYLNRYFVQMLIAQLMNIFAQLQYKGL